MLLLTMKPEYTHSLSIAVYYYFCLAEKAYKIFSKFSSNKQVEKGMTELKHAGRPLLFQLKASE